MKKVSGSSGFRWTVVVLTCQHKDSVYSFQRGEDYLRGGGVNFYIDRVYS